MAFQVIKAETRTTKLIEWFAGMCQQITDFAVGSKFRTKFETVAVEMEEQDYNFEQAMRQAIPISIYQAFGFGLIAASRATGKVVFSATKAPTKSIKITAGTRLATVATSTQAEKLYETVADVYLQVGETTVEAEIIAVTAGTVGNTSSQTITVIKTTITGVDAVNNVGALANGADTETDEARRIRFQTYIDTIVRGTKNAIAYGAKLAQIADSAGNITETVKFAKVVEPHLTNSNLPIGEVECYIYNGVGGTSTALVAEAQKIIDGYVDTDGTIVPGYKAAGVVCDVIPAIEDPIAITISVAADNGKTATEKIAIQADIESAFTNYIASLGLEETLLKNKLIDIAMGIDGVYNVALTIPAIDVAVGTGHIITVGTISVTVT